MKKRLLLKIVLWTIAILLVLSGILFTIGYFYYGRILKTYVIETISRESKGIYTAEIGKLNLDILNGNLTLKDFSISADTAKYFRLSDSAELSPLLIGLKIKEFKIRDFDVMKAVKERQIDIRSIRFDSPDITIFRMKMGKKDTAEKQKEKITSIPLPKGLNAIAIGEFVVEKAKMTFIDCIPDTTVVHNFPVTDISIMNILVDSVHQGKRRLFNADDISITLGGYSINSKNGMNKISFGEIGVSTAKETVYIRNFHLEPLYNYHDYSRKLGFQTDRMDIRVPSLKIERLNMRELLFGGRLIAGLITIDSLILDDYRDKRVADRIGFRPAMPQNAIRKVKSYMKIDTILLKNGKATYSEQVNEKPGTLYFDKMSASITNLTNDSALLDAGLLTEVKGTAYLMGKGRLDLTMYLKVGDRKNSFTYTAQIGPMDLRELNPMVSNLLPAKIESGQIKKMLVTQVKANDDDAAGKMVFYYNDLKIAVTDNKQTTWSKMKTGLINFTANDLIVNNDNPTKSGKLKTGTIFFQRDKSKGFFNFLWKSVLSGLKSTMGFNSKAQKEMIKEEKKHKK